jgi:hypothetical protein
MADDLNKKITIDVEINTDGQQQITQYKEAFDNFRNAINSIKSPLNNISVDFKSLNKTVSDISGSLNKLNSSTASFNSTGGKIGGVVNTAIVSFVGLRAIFDDLKIAFGEFTAEVTGGLSLLISFLPVIIDWVSGLFSADTTIKSLNQTLTEHKQILQAVNQARSQGDQNAQEELVHLKLVYNASQDHKLSLTGRLKAVKDLQAEYPAYFGNLTSEAILAGKAATAYDSLTKSIIASSRAKAAEDMMVDNSKRQITDESKTNELQSQMDEKKQQIAKLEQEYREQLKKSDRGRGGIDDDKKAQIDRLRDDLNGLQKTYNDAINDSRILDKQNQALATDISKNIEKNGVQTITSVNRQAAAYNKLGAKIDEVKNKQGNDAQQPSSGSRESDLSVTAPGLPPLDTAQAGAIPAFNVTAAQDNSQKVVSIYKTMLKQIEAGAKQSADKIAADGFSILSSSIKQQADAKIAALQSDETNALNNTSLTGAQKLAIQQKFKKEEDQIKAKAFKEEQELSIAKTLMSAAEAEIKLWADPGFPGAIAATVALAAETAAQIAQIASQKPPAYASGGLHYASDGRGGLLPGYSRSDNTNAYLRSGEGIVVSEAMREPWARNLVSAINVGFGGRDFSATTTGRGFAVGGIFTDGGNANRYYNAPVNDQKNLANTIAYQMINNFPPVYVDVKDINNQQNILAQTINRVNL